MSTRQPLDSTWQTPDLTIIRECLFTGLQYWAYFNSLYSKGALPVYCMMNTVYKVNTAQQVARTSTEA